MRKIPKEDVEKKNCAQKHFASNNKILALSRFQWELEHKLRKTYTKRTGIRRNTRGNCKQSKPFFIPRPGSSFVFRFGIPRHYFVNPDVTSDPFDKNSLQEILSS